MTRDELHECLALVANMGWSDLHLKAGSPPRVRAGGLLETRSGPALDAQGIADLAAEIVRPDLRARLDAGVEVDFAYSLDRSTRFRVNIFHQRETVAMVFRRVDTQPRTIAELGLPDTLHTLADAPRGLVAIAGPTGSGKTTTLAAMIEHINRTRKAHIVTIEDPIEFTFEDRLASVTQREIGVDTEDFATGLRSALRQDPDVLLVGELRDTETAIAAMRAAETGHLVLCTLHTASASETVTRILDFFPEARHQQIRLALAGCLRGVVCQRLVPRAHGRGLVPATEILVTTGRVQASIAEPRRNTSIDEIIAQGEYYGMHTFDQSLVRLFQEGTIEFNDAMTAASDSHDLTLMLRQRGLLGAAS